jgi:hypothetical protein
MIQIGYYMNGAYRYVGYLGDDEQLEPVYLFIQTWDENGVVTHTMNNSKFGLELAEKITEICF